MESNLWSKISDSSSGSDSDYDDEDYFAPESSSILINHY